jgi:uncharacterized membrane protein YdcZ (DUF606 family)
LENFHGEGKGYAQWWLLFESLIEAFYLVFAVIMLLCAIALLPLSTTILIISLGQVIWPIISSRYSLWTKNEDNGSKLKFLELLFALAALVLVLVLAFGSAPHY